MRLILAFPIFSHLPLTSEPYYSKGPRLALVSLEWQKRAGTHVSTEGSKLAGLEARLNTIPGGIFAACGRVRFPLKFNLDLSDHW